MDKRFFISSFSSFISLNDKLYISTASFLISVTLDKFFLIERSKGIKENIPIFKAIINYIIIIFIQTKNRVLSTKEV